jgi:hypothetical protein
MRRVQHSEEEKLDIRDCKWLKIKKRRHGQVAKATVCKTLAVGGSKGTGILQNFK